jgi:hypothetical protein
MKTNTDPIIDAVTDARLDELLVLWLRFYGQDRHQGGYAPASPMFRDTKSNWSPYDRDNGVAENEVDRSRAREIGKALFQVPNTPQLWRSVLMLEAHNLSAQVRVWRNCRLPDGEEYEVLRMEARIKFWNELQRLGCLGG